MQVGQTDGQTHTHLERFPHLLDPFTSAKTKLTSKSILLYCVLILK